MTLDHVTVDNNSTTSGEGSAIEQGMEQGALTIKSSTISNHNSGSVNVINVTVGTVSIINSTISGNSTTTGSTLWIESPATLTTTQMTFFNNTSTLVHDIWTNLGLGTLVTFQNSIIQGSCQGNGYASSGGNVISPLFGCGLSVESGDVDNVADLKLGPLAKNGGETLTHMPLEGSVVIDLGVNTNCDSLTMDQRDLPRKVDTLGGGARCDSGAVEVQPVVLEEIILKSSFEDDES